MRLCDTQIVLLKLKFFLLYYHMTLGKFLLGNLDLNALLKLLLSDNLFINFT